MLSPLFIINVAYDFLISLKATTLSQFVVAGLQESDWMDRDGIRSAMDGAFGASRRPWHYKLFHAIDFKIVKSPYSATLHTGYVPAYAGMTH